MSLTYQAAILVFFLLTVVVLLAWYDFITAFNRKGSTSVLPLNIIDNNAYGYLGIKENNQIKGLAFNNDNAELYFTEDKSQWQDFIYDQKLGLLKANDQRIGIVYFNDLITLSNIQNTRFSQSAKLQNNNLILNVHDRLINKQVSLTIDEYNTLKPNPDIANNNQPDFYFILQHN